MNLEFDDLTEQSFLLSVNTEKNKNEINIIENTNSNFVDAKHIIIIV